MIFLNSKLNVFLFKQITFATRAQTVTLEYVVITIIVAG